MRVCENVHVCKAVWEVCVHYWGKVLSPAGHHPCSVEVFFFLSHDIQLYQILFNLFVPNALEFNNFLCTHNRVSESLLSTGMDINI